MAAVTEKAPSSLVDVRNRECLHALREMPDESINAVVTDPPYGLADLGADKVCEALTHWCSGDRDFIPQGRGFMNRSWDCFVPPPAVWDECLRVLKPGGYAFVFAGSRTQDLMGMSLRLAGFETKDTIMWAYGSGMPKSKGVLKPAYEPILVVRKPFKGSAKANIERYGTGAMNIDACRTPCTDSQLAEKYASIKHLKGRPVENAILGGGNVQKGADPHPAGRWPTNVVFSHLPECQENPTRCVDGCPVSELDEQSGVSVSRKGKPRGSAKPGEGWGATKTGAEYDDEGGASRYFPTFRYQAKAPTHERPKYVNADGEVIQHMTVKPLDLMKWLARLSCGAGGTILDPFVGSGTTVEAAILEGLDIIAIEREAEFIPLIEQRIARANRVLAESAA